MSGHKGGICPLKDLVEDFKNHFFHTFLHFGNHFLKMHIAKILLILSCSQIKSLNPLAINTFLGGRNKVIHI